MDAETLNKIAKELEVELALAKQAHKISLDLGEDVCNSEVIRGKVIGLMVAVKTVNVELLRTVTF